MTIQGALSSLGLVTDPIAPESALKANKGGDKDGKHELSVTETHFLERYAEVRDNPESLHVSICLISRGYSSSLVVRGRWGTG